MIADRDFTWHDDVNSPKVAIVNETFARKVFGSVSNAIGGYFMRGPDRRIQVVGVVQDGKYRTLVYEATPRDPLVVCGVVATMVLLGFAAGWLPARRAAGVDPAILLREE